MFRLESDVIFYKKLFMETLKSYCIYKFVSLNSVLKINSRYKQRKKMADILRSAFSLQKMKNLQIVVWAVFCLWSKKEYRDKNTWCQENIERSCMSVGFY